MEMKLFNFSKFLDDHPVFELVYKAFLASGLAIIFFYLASIGNENGGAYLKEAIESGDKGLYWNVLSSFGIMFFLGGMWFKNIDFKISNNFIKTIWSYPSTIIQKIAQDVLLSSFSLSSAFLGYIVFTYIVNFSAPDDFWLLTLIVSWGGLSLGFLTSVLGFFVYVLKVKGDHIITTWLKQRNIFLVIFMYPLLSFLFWWFFWNFKP